MGAIITSKILAFRYFLIENWNKTTLNLSAIPIFANKFKILSRMKLLTLQTLLGLLLCASTLSSQITFDGTINESQWGAAASTSSGGPIPGFGAGHEINALYVNGDANNINIGVAGNVQNGNRIVLFLDTKTGGYNNGNYGRTGAPNGVNNFNSGTSFDAGFNADYALVIGTNAGSSNYFVDLFTLAGTAAGGGGSNSFLGSPNGTTIGAAPANSSQTAGFEIAVSKTALGYLSSFGEIKVFAIYMSDGAFLSNQFLTPAGSSDGNYGNGAVVFGSAAPNPVTIAAAALPVELVDIAAKAVKEGILVSWRTAMERDNSHFEVEYSNNGQIWETLDRVTGKGTPSPYTYLHETHERATHYYRLKQVDIDGYFAYSKVVSTTLKGNAAYSLAPNPVFTDAITLKMESMDDVNIQFFNVAGQLVHTLHSTSATQGLEIEVASWPTGTYWLQINQELPVQIFVQH